MDFFLKFLANWFCWTWIVLEIRSLFIKYDKKYPLEVVLFTAAITGLCITSLIYRFIH